MRTLLLLALLLAACAPPPAPALPPTAPVVRVGIADGLDWTAWRDDQRTAIESYLPTLARVGVRWLRVSVGDADVLVRSWDSGPGCLRGAGRYVVGWRHVEVDAACAGGLDGLRYATGHELLHWLTWRSARWVGHVCKRGDEALDCHPTVRGRSLLNPVLPEEHEGTLGSLLVDAVPTDTDRALLRALQIVR